ncbi:MAG: DegT/DnrJ/EryC1/StrS family aminotransferase [Chloroflexi bacterium]|nr:DegT/DnrJ/EryC1/StrS family aminotransferase [Chloroflexota bacterium]
MTRLAIDGGEPLRTQPFPSWPQWDGAERSAVLGVLESGQWWSLRGHQVRDLEAEFAAYQDAHYAVAVTNGSAALEVCLRAAGIDWGDEVITSPYTFIATASACLLVGAIPLFTDILPDTWNMDPSQIEALISPRTKAIMPVHIGGEPVDMDAVMAIARKHNLLVIEDACQAHGAVYKGTKVGAIGDMGCFSFQASKNITGGEGGMIVSNSEEWADRCWSVHNVGRQRGKAWYHHPVVASNYRMTEWPAAVLRVQLKRIEEQTEQRAASAKYLTQVLQQVPGLQPTTLPADTTRSANHLFRFWYQPAAFDGKPASEFIRAMNAEGIPVTPGYPEPLGATEAIMNRIAVMCRKLGLAVPEQPDCPVAREVGVNGLWLHQSVMLGSREDMDQIAAAAFKIQQAWGSAAN